MNVYNIGIKGRHQLQPYKAQKILDGLNVKAEQKAFIMKICTKKM